MEAKQYVVIGAGGHAKVVVDLLRKNEKKIWGLTDAVRSVGETCLGVPVLGKDDVLSQLRKEGIGYAAMGIGHVGKPSIRNRVFLIAKELGYVFPVIIHPTACLAGVVQIGDGSIVCAQSVINPEAQIGQLCIINTAAVVEHEVVIEDGVHIAPHATILGEACIGENTFIGANSVILQGVHIGSNCIIGAGSVVLHDVPDHCVVVGVPGRIMKRI